MRAGIPGGGGGGGRYSHHKKFSWVWFMGKRVVGPRDHLLSAILYGYQWLISARLGFITFEKKNLTGARLNYAVE